MKNMVALIKGERAYEPGYFKSFEVGDAVSGDGAEPETLRTWDADEDGDAARAALLEHPSVYERGKELYYVTEYALEWYRADDDGEFLDGSNYDIAESAGAGPEALRTRGGEES